MCPSPENDKDHADKDADTYSNKDADKEADEQIYAMKVPKFWNPSILKQDVRQFLGNNGQRLISADEASRIGSYTPSLTNYDVEQGDAELKVAGNTKTCFIRSCASHSKSRGENCGFLVYFCTQYTCTQFLSQIMLLLL